MAQYVAVITMICLIGLVLVRSRQLKNLGIRAVQFGEMDKKDFIIPPFAIFFFYIVLAETFNLPKVGSHLFTNVMAQWLGAIMCLGSIVLFAYAIKSFGDSFRVGLDEKSPGKLVTQGAFAISRNPIYTAFGGVLLGTFLIMPNWIIFIYLIVGYWLFNRQVLLEEASLQKIYGRDYENYMQKVRRYL